MREKKIYEKKSFIFIIIIVVLMNTLLVYGIRYIDNHPLTSDIIIEYGTETPSISEETVSLINEETTVNKEITIEHEYITLATNEDKPDSVIVEDTIKQNVYDIVPITTIKDETNYTAPVVNCLSDSKGKELAYSNINTYGSITEKTEELINKYRLENGLYALDTTNNTLKLLAYHRASENAYMEFMYVKEIDGRKRHIRPNGKVATSICNLYGITSNYGENEGRGQNTPKEIFNGWKNSVSHNALMLSPSYSYMSVGLALGNDGMYYWTLSVIG